MARPSNPRRNRRPLSTRRRLTRFEQLEDRRLLAVLLADSFEQAEWNGTWVEDSQNDWARRSQRASDGAYSAEIDGSANDATLTLANPLDLTTYDSAELTFSWYIESNWDGGEYIAVDRYDGNSWTELASLQGNVDQENVWHNETITIDGSYLVDDFKIRFRANVSSSKEDGFVDNVKIESVSAALPSLSIDDASANEAGSTWGFVDTLPLDGDGVAGDPWGIAKGSNGDLYVSFSDDISGASRIERIDAITGEVEHDFIPLGTSGLNKAKEIVVHDGWIYVSNKTTNEILRFDEATGAPDAAGAFVSSGLGGLSTPRGMAFNAAGDLLVSSKGTDQILKFSGVDGTSMGVFASAITSGGTGPKGLTLDATNSVLYVAGNDRIYEYSAGTGTLLGQVTAPELTDPTDLAFGPDGDLYASNSTTQEVLQFNATTGSLVAIITVAPSYGAPQGIAFDDAGSLYAAPNLTIGEVIRYARSSSAVFTLSLSASSATPVSVDFAMTDVSATAGVDYTSASGTLIFDPGVTTRTIVVPTIDDLDVEGDETFTLTLTTPVGATISDGEGLGTILDNEEPANVPPAANAGPDQTAGDGDDSGSEVVALSGSGSDSDGTITGYEWKEGATVLGATASISPTLTVGTHTLTLTVTDNEGATASDTVVVTVDPNQGPTADAGADQAVADGTAATLIGSGSDSDGTITGYEWKEGTAVLGTTASISATLGLGAHTLTLTVTDNGGATASDTVIVTVNPVVVTSTKFYVVDDSVDDMFEYQADGTVVENYNLGSSNNSPRGVAADITGNTVWVIDNDDYVYVHDNDGNLLRSWKASGLSRPEGIATDGTDVWIVDRGNDRVHYFSGGATRTGNTGATSSFSLAAGDSRGITTDGTHLWVVDAGTDDVYKYTVGGTLIGSWALDGRNTSPQGITIDPANVNDIWVIDSGDDDIYQYSGAASRTSGSQAADAAFALAGGNTNPKGIADPPPMSDPVAEHAMIDIDIDWSQSQLVMARGSSRPIDSPTGQNKDLTSATLPGPSSSSHMDKLDEVADQRRLHAVKGRAGAHNALDEFFAEPGEDLFTEELLDGLF